MFLVITRLWCTVRRSIHTRPLPILQLGITPRVWRSRLGLELLWERLGAAVGAITAGGAGTTTSPSIETTPSSTTPIGRTFRIGRPAVATAGSIIRNTAGVLPTQTERPPTSMVAQLAEIQCQIGKQMPVRTRVNREAGDRLVLAIGVLIGAGNKPVGMIAVQAGETPAAAAAEVGLAT